MEAWPESVLPLPTLDFSGSNEPFLSRTEMSSGRTRQTRRFSTDVKTVEASWLFDGGDFDMFESFVYFKLHGGCDMFTLPLLVGDAVKIFTLRFVGGRYQFALEEGNWRVSASLEILDQQYVPEDVYDTLLVLGSVSGLEEAAESYRVLIHQSFPAAFPG